MVESNKTNRVGKDEFFVPDFCAGRAVFILVLVTELFVIAIALAGTGVRNFSWDYLALVSLFAQWIVLGSAAVLCWTRAGLRRLPLAVATACIFVLVLAVTAITTLIASWIMAGASLSEPALNIDPYGMLRNLVISAIMTGLVLRYFYVHSQLRKQERAELQARIQALQARIRPHFLFNSMNSIASLIGSDPQTAERVVEDLAELFRASLREGDAPVRLEEEIELCRRYLEIEQLRLGSRMRIEWKIDTFPDDVTIPLLSLQPLLENAIYHGIQPLPEGGVIGILIQCVSGEMQIVVTNPLGKKAATHTSNNNHIALDNIQSRFRAIYGEAAKLTTQLGEDMFVTRLSWPAKAPE